MWFSFWRSRDRLSLNQLRYLTDELHKVQIVNQVNKDFVIESLRSIAELITYGDQHDSSYFEHFMEKQVMGEFVRILKVSKTVVVSLQLLQTMSIMIQNLRSDHAIYYLFSNEHINSLITYEFDFCNEELLSYYISFLRAISGKLNSNTISLLVKTYNEQVVAFPLYSEAIRFAFHEETMIRTAVRTITLNIYHVGDESVNHYITMAPQANYFSDLVTFFRKKCIDISGLVCEYQINAESDASRTIIIAVDEIEDHLYYFSDAISAGIPDLARLLTDLILKYLIFPLLLPSLSLKFQENVRAIVAMYLLGCILRIVKIKDLANTIAAALLCCPEAFLTNSDAKVNGYGPENSKSTTPRNDDDVSMGTKSFCSCMNLRDVLLSYISSGNEQEVIGSLNILAIFLQTKELDELMLDALGILPDRKQQKKLLLQALVGEEACEAQLFSSESTASRDTCVIDLDGYLMKLKETYGVLHSTSGVGKGSHLHRVQVLDVLVNMFSRSNISAETLWDCGWLLKQLLPYSVAEFESRHTKLLRDSYTKYAVALIGEITCDWPDLLIPTLYDEWKKCKRVIEASSPRKDPKSIILSLPSLPSNAINEETSYHSGAKMREVVKVFVLLCQLQIFSMGKVLVEEPPVGPSVVRENERVKTAGLESSTPKPGKELKLVDAIPCRISFERGKERHLFFLAFAVGESGWILLAEELPLKEQLGVIRVVAPLASSNPKIDEKHEKWLHLRIRPFSLPCWDSLNTFVTLERMKSKTMVDGKWTLAFRDVELCKAAVNMIHDAINQQRKEVERRIKPVVEFIEASSIQKPSCKLSGVMDMSESSGIDDSLSSCKIVQTTSEDSRLMVPD